MRSTALTLLLSTFICGAVSAQSDSLTVVKAAWKTEKVAPGVKLKTFWFNKNLFSANQNVSILEIKPKKSVVLDLGFDAKKLIYTSEFGKAANAIAALNGTFFDVTNGGSVDFIKSDGQIVNENRLGKNGERAGHQQSAVALSNGRLSIVKWDGSADWEKNIKGEDVMVSGPLLIMDKLEEKLDSNSFNVTRHPRTAVAVTRNNRILLVTVDGRNDNSAGMSLFELTHLMRWLNADDAINLDGGGSTTLWINGQPGNGIVNYPTDNKKWDHEGERKVANVLLLRKR